MSIKWENPSSSWGSWPSNSVLFCFFTKNKCGRRICPKLVRHWMICAVRLRISWNSRKNKDFTFRPKLNLTASQVWRWANNVSVCLFSKCKWLRTTFEGYCEDLWFCFVKDQIQCLAYSRCLVNVATVKMLLFLVLINKNGIWKKCLSGTPINCVESMLKE